MAQYPPYDLTRDEIDQEIARKRDEDI